MRRTAKVLLHQHGNSSAERRPDEVVVEEPLEIRIDGQRVATTMRTPGHDFELAVGFLQAEGLLAGARVRTVRYCGTGSAMETEFNVVTVETNGRGPEVSPRLGPLNSACGVCGSDQLDALSDRLVPFADLAPFSSRSLPLAFASLAQRQELFDRTGGTHAAALVTPDGSIAVVREDIGRHNALDKVSGRLRLDGAADKAEHAVYVTSRASYEMVQKAWAAGIGTIVASGAPSAMAIRTASVAGMNLLAFAKGSSFNVYAGAVAD